MIQTPLDVSEHHDDCPDNKSYGSMTCVYDCPFHDFSGTGDTDPIEFRRMLARVDNSQPYEMDVAGLIQTRTGFAVIHLSGCSCWDGWGTTYTCADPVAQLDTLIKGESTYSVELFKMLKSKLMTLNMKECRRCNSWVIGDHDCRLQLESGS